jgi:quercetin dioxygenase-like cupin family protein
MTPTHDQQNDVALAWFTGQVWFGELGSLATPAAVRMLRVTFAPGARTAWHAHPLGQILHVVDGVARIGREGRPPFEARPGDTIRFDPGERHWHGAGPDRPMTHLTVQAADPDGGQETVWGERVSDRAYAGEG